MSIILDALKKMEGEGAAKGRHEKLPAPPGVLSGWKKGLILSLAAAALALNLLAVILWLGMRDGANERGVGETVERPVERQPAVAPGGTAPLPAIADLQRPVATPETVDPGPDPTLGTGAAAKVDGKSAEMAAVLPPSPPDTVAIPVTVSPVPPGDGEIPVPDERAAAEGVQADEEGEAYDGSVLSVEELPGHLRPGVEDLRISAHVYSDDPSFRRVAVNDDLKREGDMVATDLVVEEITEGGAVFSYRGYRFSLRSH
jgi:hypothetical protein